jgi:hypothetical protein
MNVKVTALRSAFADVELAFFYLQAKQDFW